MSATPKQIALIEELQNRGAAIPATDSGNPDNSMFESVQAADAYIKQWGHLMRKGRTSLSAGEWGGVLNA